MISFKSFHCDIEHADIKKCLEKCVLNTHIAKMLTNILYFPSGIIIFCYPIIYYLITHKKILHFGFVLPWLDWESPMGYTVNFMHHSLQIYNVMIAFVGSNSLHMIFIMNLYGQYDALNILLRDLNILAEANSDNCNDQKIKAIIIEITDKHVGLVR